MRGAPGLVWDACALLNLLATNRAEEILPLFGCPSYVVKEVREAETLYLRPLREEDPDSKLIAVDLSALIDSDVLRQVELTTAEERAFATFAAAMDDGEARSAAVALERGWWLVTDDRVSLRVAAACSPPIVTRTTPDWVRFYAEAAAIERAALSELLRRIEVCASYYPRRAHPLSGWWNAGR